jgi:hypothetical protein
VRLSLNSDTIYLAGDTERKWILNADMISGASVSVAKLIAERLK